jgi:hypothetical protein
MSKVKLINTRKKLKTWLQNPKNKNNHSEKLNVLNELNRIKIKLREIEYNKRAGIIEKPKSKSDSEFQEHIDQYRYYSILKRLNDQYIKCNCKFNINDKVITKDNRFGFINKIIVYSDKVTRNQSGIYLILNMCKNDGTKGNKLLRRSRLDTKGFPIEEVSLYIN